MQHLFRSVGPDGSAMTMTNPNELVDVDLFLEIILEELADAMRA